MDVSAYSPNEVNKVLRGLVERGRVRVVNAAGFPGLAAGLRKGEVVVDGDCGDYLGMLNHGARIEVTGSVGRFVGDGAWSGEIVVKGDAGEGAGVYAYGGTIVVKGDVEGAVGQLLKSATVVVGGCAGDLVGLYMVGGRIIVLGDVGRNAGNWMVRGSIYVGGGVESLGMNVKEVKPSEEEVRELKALLRRYGLEAPEGFRKLVSERVRPFYGRVR